MNTEESPRKDSMPTSTLSSATEPKSAATALEKTWKQEFLNNANFPPWTKSQNAITTPLKFPEKSEASSQKPVDEETACLLCEETFYLPKGQNNLLKHLLETHSLVIADVHLICDLAAYVKYWKRKFLSKNLDEVCSVLNAEVKEGGKDTNVQDFYLLSDVLPEDRELRVLLQMKKLEEVLAIQERERNDSSFRRTCLFCRTVFEGKHALLFDHMAHDHNFSVGQPNNLVFVNELLDVLERKLEEQVCVYCEKVFKTRDVLKEHMRKKGHKKINPKNSFYDKFYVVNYREFGKNWEILSRENECEDDELPTGFDSDNEADEAEWNDWLGDQPGAVCLFCPATYYDMNDLLIHMTSIHDFDFQHVRNSMKLSFYQQVKLINYIRRQVHLNQCIFCSESFDDTHELMEHMTVSNHLRVPDGKDEWDQPQYYFPTYENDNLLSLLDDDLYENDEVPVQSEDVPESVTKSILNEEECLRALRPAASKRGVSVIGQTLS